MQGAELQILKLIAKLIADFFESIIHLRTDVWEETSTR